MWSIEAAVERGRRAARVFERGVIVLPRYRPWLLRTLGAIDDLLFRLRAPQVLDVMAIATIVAIATGNALVV